MLHKGSAGVLQLRVPHCDLDPAAAAGGVALIERAQNADGQQHAGAGVAQGRPGLARAPVALAGDRHRATVGDHVESEIVLIGAALAESLDLGIDEAWVQRVEIVPAEPQPLDRTGQSSRRRRRHASPSP